MTDLNKLIRDHPQQTKTRREWFAFLFKAHGLIEDILALNQDLTKARDPDEPIEETEKILEDELKELHQSIAALFQLNRNEDDDYSLQFAANVLTKELGQYLEDVEDSIIERQQFWKLELEAWYFQENDFLNDQGDIASLKAAEFLDQIFLETSLRVEKTWDALAAEDYLGVSSLYRSTKHLEWGEAYRERELKKLERELAALERRKNRLERTAKNETSIYEDVWGIVGWNSWEDFLGDVILTVLTGGIAKAAKITGKASRRLSKARRLKKASEKATEALLKVNKLQNKLKTRLKKLNKLRKVAAPVGKIIQLMGFISRTVTDLLLNDDIEQLLKILREGKIEGKIITDLIGRFSQGKDLNAVSVAVNRLGKETITAYILDYYQWDKEEEKEAFRMMGIYFFSGKRDKSRQSLFDYLKRNFRRHLTVEFTYNVVLSFGHQTVKLDWNIVKPILQSQFMSKVIASTVSQMIKDFSKNLVLFFPIQEQTIQAGPWKHFKEALDKTLDVLGKHLKSLLESFFNDLIPKLNP